MSSTIDPMSQPSGEAVEETDGVGPPASGSVVSSAPGPPHGPGAVGGSHEVEVLDEEALFEAEAEAEEEG